MNGTVHFVLTVDWYNEVASGRKTVEYRARTPYWHRRLFGRWAVTEAVFHRGYTTETVTRRVVGIDVGQCPYPGWRGLYYRVHLATEGGVA